MSRKNRHHPSARGDLNVPTTEPIAQPPAEPNAHTQETTLEASQEKTEPSSPEELTAKAMAQAEEENAARVKALIDRQQAQAAAQAAEDIALIHVASQGMDVLHEAIRKASEPKMDDSPIPPPRTERQMTQLEQELEAGRRTQARHAAQLANRPPPEKDPNEGVTNPVHRPGDMVPDPMRGGLAPINQ